MSVPLSRLYSTPDTRLYNRLREIENNYFLETTTERVADLVTSQTEILSALARQAESDHELLESFGEFSDAIQDSLDSLSDALNETRNAIEKQTTILGVRLEEISRTMLQQQLTLTSIADTLRRPFETQVLELRREADKWFRNGLNNQGDERTGDLRDAERLLAEIVKNPIGNQDYVTWFQLGYLRWKLDVDFTAAEAAFNRAVRLSAPAKDLWHLKSLRHLAHVQALSGNYQRALESILRAAELDPSAGVHFETARYETRLGHSDRAIVLLERAIEQQPTLLISAFTDEDLAPVRPAIGRLAEAKRRDALERAKVLFDSAHAAVAPFETWNPSGGVAGDLVSRLSRAKAQIQTGRFFQLLEVIDILPAILDQAPGALEFLQAQAEDQWHRRRRSLKGAYQHLKSLTGRSQEPVAGISAVHAEYELLMRHASPASAQELDELLDKATRLQNRVGLLRQATPDTRPFEKTSQRTKQAGTWLSNLFGRFRSLLKQ